MISLLLIVLYFAAIVVSLQTAFMAPSPMPELDPIARNRVLQMVEAMVDVRISTGDLPAELASRISTESNMAQMASLKAGILLYHGVESLSDPSPSSFSSTVWFATVPEHAVRYTRSPDGTTLQRFRVYRLKKALPKMLWFSGLTAYQPSVNSNSPLQVFVDGNSSQISTKGIDLADRFCAMNGFAGWATHTVRVELMLCNYNSTGRDSLLEYLELVQERLIAPTLNPMSFLPLNMPHNPSMYLNLHWGSLAAIHPEYNPGVNKALAVPRPSNQNRHVFVETLTTWMRDSSCADVAPLYSDIERAWIHTIEFYVMHWRNHLDRAMNIIQNMPASLYQQGSGLSLGLVLPFIHMSQYTNPSEEQWNQIRMQCYHDMNAMVQRVPATPRSELSCDTPYRQGLNQQRDAIMEVLKYFCQVSVRLGPYVYGQGQGGDTGTFLILKQVQDQFQWQSSSSS